jgi:hypothetical protein
MRPQLVAVWSLFCAVVFCAGCPSAGDPLIGIVDPVPVGSPVPDELTGQWQSILAYVPANYEGFLPIRDVIGSYGVFYYFTADGQYQIDLRAMASYFDFMCYFNDHRQEWGTVEIVGADYTFHPAHAFESGFDSCGDSVYIDPAPTQAQTVTLIPEVDATGWPLLRLIFPDGEELVLERCRDCE